MCIVCTALMDMRILNTTLFVFTFMQKGLLERRCEFRLKAKHLEFGHYQGELGIKKNFMPNIVSATTQGGLPLGLNYSFDESDIFINYQGHIILSNFISGLCRHSCYVDFI